jgi:hypothetical protein
MKVKIKLTIHKALFGCVVYVHPFWENAADSHNWKFQRLQNTFLHARGKPPRPATA